MARCQLDVRCLGCAAWRVADCSQGISGLLQESAALGSRVAIAAGDAAAYGGYVPQCMRRLGLFPGDDVHHRGDGVASDGVVSTFVGGQADAAFRHRPDDRLGLSLSSGPSLRPVAKVAGTLAGSDAGIQLRRSGDAGAVPGAFRRETVYLFSVLASLRGSPLPCTR